MKNKKIQLEQLKVKSFVTHISQETEDTIKGGISEGGCVGTGVSKCVDGDSGIPQACGDGNNQWASILFLCSLVC